MKYTLSLITILLSWAFLSFTPITVIDSHYKVDVYKSSLEWVGKKFTGEHTGTLALKSGVFTMGVSGSLPGNL